MEFNIENFNRANTDCRGHWVEHIRNKYKDTDSMVYTSAYVYGCKACGMRYDIDLVTLEESDIYWETTNGNQE